MNLISKGDIEVLKRSLTKEEFAIINRMYEKDDYVVSGTGNYFWANSSHRGCLIEGCTSEERTLIFQLHNRGILRKDSKTIYI